MAYHKKVVTPLLIQWSDRSLVLKHWNEVCRRVKCVQYAHSPLQCLHTMSKAAAQAIHIHVQVEVRLTPALTQDAYVHGRGTVWVATLWEGVRRCISRGNGIVWTYRGLPREGLMRRHGDLSINTRVEGGSGKGEWGGQGLASGSVPTNKDRQF